MSTPTPKELTVAVLSNSVALVEKLLAGGADVNAVLDDSTIPLVSDFPDNGNGYHNVARHVKVCLDSETGFVTPLHLAVVNVYFSSGRENNNNTFKGESNTELKRALDLLKLLLKHGASTSKECEELILCHLSKNKCPHFEPDSDSFKALDLALFLKRYPFDKYGACTDLAMETVIQIIQEYEASTCKTLQIDRVPVVKETVDAYKSMLFSEKFSDMSFLCSDEVMIPAHRIILAASSPYFAAALDGHWVETSSGIWKTRYKSSLVKPILTLLYTGVIEEKLCAATDQLELLEIGSVYDIKTIISLAVDACIGSLDSSNVMERLQAASLHQNTKLKQACFGFIKRNAASILIQPEVMALATENKPLWAELTEAIAPSREN